MAPVVQIFDLCVDSRKFSAIGAIGRAVLNGKCGVLNIGRGAVHISAVRTVDQEFTLSRNKNSCVRSGIELNSLAVYPCRVFSVNTERRVVFDIERNAALPRIDRAVRSAGGVKRKGHSRSVPGADRPAKDHCDPSCRFAIIGSGRICVSMNVQVRTIKDQVTVIPPAVYIQIHGMSTGEGK